MMMPPATSSETCTMSVSATALRPPYSAYNSANNASAVMAYCSSSPVIALTARAPSQRIEVRFTKMYSASQNTAITLRTAGLYRFSRNSGIV
jgi:hypothetical protein